MAAAEYFSSAPMTGQQQQPYEMSSSQSRPPTSNPFGNSHNNNTPIPEIQTHPPPPRPAQHQSNNYPGAPTNNYQQYSPNHQSPNLRPYQPQPQNSYPSSQPIPINQQRPQRPYGSVGHTPPMNYMTPPYGSASPQQQYLTPQMRPHANSYPSQLSLESGYSSDPEQQRRRRNRRHGHHGHHDDHESSRDLERSTRPRSRSGKTDAWVGAAGGGLIGDLIFPGLGTLGGAAIGWLGGKEYGNKRKVREDKRHDEQREWERKWRPNEHGHHRSRSRSGDREHHSRGSSQMGERRGSHDSRRSHH